MLCPFDSVRIPVAQRRDGNLSVNWYKNKNRCFPSESTAFCWTIKPFVAKCSDVNLQQNMVCLCDVKNDQEQLEMFRIIFGESVINNLRSKQRA